MGQTMVLRAVSGCFRSGLEKSHCRDGGKGGLLAPPCRSQVPNLNWVLKQLKTKFQQETPSTLLLDRIQDRCGNKVTRR